MSELWRPTRADVVPPVTREEAVFQADRFAQARKAIQQTRLGGEALWNAAVAMIDAQRAAGQWFTADPDYGPGKSTLSVDFQMPPQTAIYRWQRAGAIDDATYQRYLDKCRVTFDDPNAKRTDIPTIIGLIRHAAAASHRATTTTPALPDGTYRALVVDPPWPIERIETDVRPNQHAGLAYPTMPLEKIEELPVGDLASEAGAHLYLWTTHRFLPDALSFAAAWGFRYQCLLTWVKNVGITPFSWMYDTEHVVFARRGSLDLSRRGLRLSIHAPTAGHSVKPDQFYSLVAEASPGPRLDMFARSAHEGFQPWGAEAP